MTKLEGMTNDQMSKDYRDADSSFRLRASFVIRHSRFVIHRTIVSPRAGPTLTMESLAPVSSEMNLTYLLAAKGSCENLRAVCMDVFQPATSS
jgi:hypothetical protein